MRKSRKRDLRAGDRAGRFRARRAGASHETPAFPVIRLFFNLCGQLPGTARTLAHGREDSESKPEASDGSIR